jgi:GNAT superfamily N-acetyltransferase
VEAADFVAPTGHFVVGYLDGAPAAMGGWRRLGDRPGLPSPNTAEIKRMYVAPGARRRGLSRVVLAELESTARAAGIDWLVLETGQPQASAVRLYRTSGYVEVDGSAYGHYLDEPDVVHLGKSLHVAGPPG